MIKYLILDMGKVLVYPNNPYFKDYNEICEKNVSNLIKSFSYYIKYDIILNNCMCQLNCRIDNIKYIGSLYGYFREPEVMLEQSGMFNNEDIIQVMTHPGFYFKMLKHKSIFSNKDRYDELKSLRKIKKAVKNKNIYYTDYNKTRKEGI